MPLGEREEGRPVYKAVAEKYKGKPDAGSALYKHLTTGTHGQDRRQGRGHEAIKTKNDAEIKNVIGFILIALTRHQPSTRAMVDQIWSV